MPTNPLDRQARGDVAAGPLLRQSFRIPREDSKCISYGVLRWDAPDAGWLERVEPLVAYIKQYVAPGARILDGGCEDGALSGLLLKEGYDVWAIDQDIAGVAMALARGVRAECLSLYDMRLTGPWDVVVMSDVLEHLPWPDAALANLARVTKRLIITTPKMMPCTATAKSQFRTTVTIKGDTKDGWVCAVCGVYKGDTQQMGTCGEPNPRGISAWHATEWTEKRLRKLLTQNGWKPGGWHEIKGKERVYYLVDCRHD